MDDDKPRDFPFDEMCRQAQKRIMEDRATIYQKFTCAGCGQRLTIDVPNKFFEEGTCDQCSAITNIRKQGCNFLMRIEFGLDATHPDAPVPFVGDSKLDRITIRYLDGKATPEEVAELRRNIGSGNWVMLESIRNARQGAKHGKN